MPYGSFYFEFANDPYTLSFSKNVVIAYKIRVLMAFTSSV